MRTNPFYDTWLFLSGGTADQINLGWARWPETIFFLGLLVASVWLASVNWRADPAQRTAGHVTNWLARVTIGAMWFQGSLWKLPLPVSPGLRYWTEQITTNAAFTAHRELVRDVLLPNLYLLNPLIFLAELSFGIALILGFAVRLFSLGAILFTINLWFGLYFHPNEWPWLFVFIIVNLVLFIGHAAGRSLGLDALWRRHPPAALAGDGVGPRLYRAVS